MSIVGIIPARFKSTRFPGKPLADINGKPMIWHVYKQSKQAELLDDLYVATEDHRILNTCKELNIKAILTSDLHSTGTDRVAECARTIDADYYVNIQGDEPMIDPCAIDMVARSLISEGDNNVMASNAFIPLLNPSDVIDTNIVKVVMSRSNIAMTYSRAPIPYPKEAYATYFKQIGLYAFTKEGIRLFDKTAPSNLEKIEGIEMLRLLENGCRVKMVEVHCETISVDTESDLIRVQNLMERS
jgi:3-deoxy-manno-octulosonate cytidylyltransferase (CMP-KDO synthetase)